MAFLFQDQNQGTRNDKPCANAPGPSQPFSFIRTLTVGLGFAPNLLTLLPKEEFPKGKKALAGLGCVTLTAGGDFHPALRTSAARMNGLERIMAKRRRASKRLRHRKSACPHAVRVFRRAFPGGNRPQKLTILAASESDSGLFSN
jgi:hypothetical protein